MNSYIKHEFNCYEYRCSFDCQLKGFVMFNFFPPLSADGLNVTSFSRLYYKTKTTHTHTQTHTHTHTHKPTHKRGQTHTLF